MNTGTLRPHLAAGLVPGLIALTTASLLVAQYARSAWPFSAAPSEPAADAGAADHQGHGTAPPNGAEHAGHGAHTDHRRPSAAPPTGYAPVSLDPSKRGGLQVEVSTVEERDLARSLRAIGTVTLDETRTAHVHAKIRGWIDEIRADFVGRKVQRGDTLCTIYSQEVYAAEIELLSLLEQARPSGDVLVAAARRRLALWDVPSSEIERLERTREARRAFPLLAPRSGTVLAKQALQGMYVDPASELFTLGDVGHLWVLVDIYEPEVAHVRLGDRARLLVEGRPEPVDARVAFLAPTLDEATRTRKVRFEVESHAGTLLPGAFVTAELDLRMGRAVAVPETAVIRTGKRSIVFVAHGAPPNHFEPRQIELGPRVGDDYGVASGLESGERVATSAQFLLDSESRLRATGGTGGGHVH